ncbi:uncharacterized protein [Chelonus insularis]|uniref:uncharacterized protein n=1 Tax=Chelonus insularis TaxID=460826 RepID=UPI00158CCC6D|nr:uncharacterized protein LOC118070351 [Chelonus insularis]
MEGVFRPEKITHCTLTGNPGRGQGLNIDECERLHPRAVEAIIKKAKSLHKRAVPKKSFLHAQKVQEIMGQKLWEMKAAGKARINKMKIEEAEQKNQEETQQENRKETQPQS